MRNWPHSLKSDSVLQENRCSQEFHSLVPPSVYGNVAAPWSAPVSAVSVPFVSAALLKDLQMLNAASPGGPLCYQISSYPHFLLAVSPSHNDMTLCSCKGFNHVLCPKAIYRFSDSLRSYLEVPQLLHSHA